jgi:SWI/SNF-related matrix-associated actin-dependent regulator of chromatin subfamily A member 5
LICVPKSTLSNWMNELARWCPSLRVIRFHGTKDEREAMKEEYFSAEAAAHDGSRPERRIKVAGEWMDDNSDNPRAWDVCVTTYEICNTERKTFQRFAWKYLIIDEAHRLKNEASMFSKTVRTFHTQHRLLLTGTPLQNNLHELWALLNFLLPDIFSSADQFDEWFNLEIDDEDAKKQMISTLHKILRPFMIRRLKVDVAKGLPPKTETLVMVGMSKMQKQLYKKLLLRDLDSIIGKAGGANQTAVLNIVMQLRKCCGHPYLFEGMEDRTLDPLGEHLVENCGKLNMVDKLLKKLKERDSRVLIFTQMTRVLDILEDFMVMRGYQYCRIDGNTDYDDREKAIDDFNRENSEKFVFILSTRAGGLGINLQTADVCILYDSDWNPQQDLQAQDRCHRLGQKKPVNVYRLVSENTIEEKIVERAQQKLKLDAMVVQQGRLKDKDKVSKEEMMAAIRFGADNVFRSEESTITDEDIDVILARGEAKTKELADKIQKAEKGDLLDFRLDAGMAAQTFEGVDYSDKELRNQLRLLAHDSLGKRDRRPPPTNYNPIMAPKKSMIVNNQRIKLPKCLRLPQMEDHHFYNRERLLELGQLEFENYAMLREIGALPPREFVEQQRSLLDKSLAQEKIELLDEGYGEWTRSQYFHFVKAAAKFGRDDVASIAADMDMSEEAVSEYSDAFWLYGPTELKKDEWERVSSSIERGEKKLAKRQKLTALLKQFVSTFEHPRTEMVFANKGTTHFSLEQDRALLCAVDKYGYGNWDSVREELRRDKDLLFQHMVQGMNTDMIAKRVDYRMRQMEKECEAREKSIQSRKPANVVAAEKAIAAIREMEEWETEARTLQLQGDDLPSFSHLSEEARQNLTERLSEREPMIDRLREIEIQVRNCKNLAEETRAAILRGDQYVNYSSITLKAGGPSSKEGSHLVILKGSNGDDIEGRINQAILKVPECGVCPACTDLRSRRLCEERLKVRNELFAKETDVMENELKKGKGGKKRKHEPPSPKLTGKTSPKLLGPVAKKVVMPGLKKKPRVTSQGNKRMSIPKEIFPDFCQRIGANGTAQRMKLINTFVEDYPDVSVRQVTMKFSDVTTKDCPPGVMPPEKKSGRAFQFYLRPKFYAYLGPDDSKPDNWEKLMAEDDVIYAKEQEQKKLERKAKDQQLKEMISETTSVKSGTSDAGDVHGDYDGDETEDETADAEPLRKKAKY